MRAAINTTKSVHACFKENGNIAVGVNIRLLLAGKSYFQVECLKMGLKIAHADVVGTCITRKRGLLRKMYGYCPPCFGIQRGLCAA